MHKNGEMFDYVKEVKEMDRLVIMRFHGEIDSLTIPVINENMKKKRPEYDKKNALLDLKEITHIDSAALAMFVAMIKRRKELHTKVGLVNVPAFISNYLEVDGLKPIARIYENEEEALKDLA